MTAAAPDDVVLRIQGLVVEYATSRSTVRAVRGIDLDVRRGHALALVGESGSGKTAAMLGALGLLGSAGRVVSGSAHLLGELTSTPRRRRRLLGRQVGVVFQDPLTSLHPSLTIGDQLIEAIRIHRRDLDRRAARALAAALLDRVGVARATQRLHEYPHQWSGGMRQRAMIAMAIAHEPPLLVADEPTTALDVTVQAQILDLLREIRREAGMAVVLITHDLGVVAEFADEVAVMYHGRVVERAAVDPLFTRPRHPYSAGLLASVTPWDTSTAVARAIGGTALSAEVEVHGCAFEPRCQVGRGNPRCAEERPRLRPADNGQVACHFPLEDPARARDAS